MSAPSPFITGIIPLKEKTGPRSTVNGPQKLICRLWSVDRGLSAPIFTKKRKMDAYTRRAHEIDYHIHGEEMQCVEIELDPQETAVAESGSFMMMDEGIQMQTIF